MYEKGECLREVKVSGVTVVVREMVMKNSLECRRYLRIHMKSCIDPQI